MRPTFAAIHGKQNKAVEVEDSFEEDAAPTETAKTEMLMLSRMMDKLEKLEKIAQRAEGEDPDEDEDLMATVTKTDRNTGKEFRGSLMLVPKKFAAPEQRCSLFIFHR